MPPGLIENQEDMLVKANGFGELVEINLHRVGRDLGKISAKALSVPGSTAP